jgi:hypothetical protein
LRPNHLSSATKFAARGQIPSLRDISPAIAQNPSGFARVVEEKPFDEPGPFVVGKRTYIVANGIDLLSGTTTVMRVLFLDIYIDR